MSFFRGMTSRAIVSMIALGIVAGIWGLLIIDKFQERQADESLRRAEYVLAHRTYDDIMPRFVSMKEPEAKPVMYISPGNTIWCAVSALLILVALYGQPVAEAMERRRCKLLAAKAAKRRSRRISKGRNPYFQSASSRYGKGE